jgi:hypothetical protein
VTQPTQPTPPHRPERSRIPNFKRFLITGALVGLVIGVWVGLREPGGPSYTTTKPFDTGAAVLFLGALGAFFGAGLAGILTILLERAGRKGS